MKCVIPRSLLLLLLPAQLEAHLPQGWHSRPQAQGKLRQGLLLRLIPPQRLHPPRQVAAAGHFYRATIAQTGSDFGSCFTSVSLHLSLSLALQE